MSISSDDILTGVEAAAILVGIAITWAAYRQEIAEPTGPRALSPDRPRRAERGTPTEPGSGR